MTEHTSGTRNGGGVPRRPADEADVIVVGAGPAGSTTACYLAQAGLDVLLLEKSRFPREKVCGDGLTPRGVKALVGMGISVSEQDGWVRNKGLRVIGAGKRMELLWPELSSYPDYGLVRPRTDLDQMLARRAQQGGARLLEGVTVTGPVLDDRTGRITGVTSKSAGEDGERSYRGRIVVAADGNSSRLSVAMGLRNVASAAAALAEMRRVTRPGGRLVVCEFSTITIAPLDMLYRRYLTNVLPAIARRTARNPEAYAYLAESITDWPAQRELVGLIEAAGWSAVRWRDLSLGVVAVHVARRT